MIVQAETFHLYARVKHVFTESLRVLQFKAQCTSSSSQEVTSTYKQLGKIMQESRASLFDDYENGCEELKQVCKIAEGNGALGSRPTGAGWGGSTVSLVEQTKVKDVLAALEKEYYNIKYPGMSSEDFQNAVLVSQPATGACVYKVQD
jgi:galactokinase